MLGWLFGKSKRSEREDVEMAIRLQEIFNKIEPLVWSSGRNREQLELSFQSSREIVTDSLTEVVERDKVLSGLNDAESSLLSSISLSDILEWHKVLHRELNRVYVLTNDVFGVPRRLLIQERV